ncbi:uncharacterized protein F4807DRAFT_413087 [Annulohypoxylon truncatum]|uniref:uncharacterized protein n=1 Tax=Annulohypoxylon truncatum TaxID=327061 RepID=UPI002007310F|nr:uncharacterized protein F4807DRAFT_413087 [Annulohypoxylon truncatum]KAI1213157.1 hypothetical protein F4807DRAFT_413087 [Annulohypoxylon truncatum]
MADPLSLALGIAPLCVTAIGILIQLSSKIKLLRRHGKEIEQIRKKFEIQRGYFLDEIHLLLLNILDRRIVSAMIRDQKHPIWQDKGLEKSLRSYLGHKYDRFQEILNEARETMEDLLVKISTFTQPETAVPLWKSIRDAFRIAFKKQDYLDYIEMLKGSNTEMRMVREMIPKIKNYPVATNLLSLPSGYEIVQDMSLSLYDLLQTRASCDTGVDTQHNMKLLLNSTDEKSPKINLFFEHKLQLQGKLLPIYASCEDLAHSGSGISLSDSSCEVSQTPRRPRIRDKVHSHHLVTGQSNVPCLNDHGKQDDENLAKAGFSCGKLILRSVAFSKSSPQSFGFLDIKGNQRLVLYPGLQGLEVNPSQYTPIPLTDYLRFPVYDVVSDTDRIKLGITLVKSMLKYNSTPWWPRESTLGQVYIFHNGGRDISPYIDTLHLLIQVRMASSAMETVNLAPTPPNGEDCLPDCPLSEPVQDAMENYGIRNLTLYGLGVALIQIGLWSDIPWGDHVLVRKTVAHLPCFGKRYKKVVSKLINCDFGLGTEDLNDPELRSAIFNDIIGELESLLRTLII